MRFINSYLKLFRQPLFFACYAAVIIVSYFYWDQPLASYIHQLQLANIHQLLELITHMGLGEFYLIFFAALWIFFRFIYRRPRWAHNSLLLLLAVVASGLICDVIKIVLSRARPNEWFDHHTYGFLFLKLHANFWSFPSGHTTVITAVMLSLSLLKPKYTIVFLVIALMVMASRILLNAHYLSDVLAGIYVASYVVSYVFFREEYRWVIRREVL